jgi:hypothetical protein
MCKLTNIYLIGQLNKIIKFPTFSIFYYLFDSYIVDLNCSAFAYIVIIYNRIEHINKKIKIF